MDPITPRSLILDSYSDEYRDKFRFSREKLHELVGEIIDCSSSIRIHCEIQLLIEIEIYSIRTSIVEGVKLECLGYSCLTSTKTTALSTASSSSSTTVALSLVILLKQCKPTSSIHKKVSAYTLTL